MSTRIEGFILLLSPAHQTRAGVEGFLDHTPSGFPRVSLTDKRKGRVNPTAVSPLFHGGDRKEVPIISGASLRGVLRRKATRIMLGKLNQRIRTDLFQCISAGAAHRKDMGGFRTAQMLATATQHVFVGLFGGGGSGLPSHFTCGDMLPITEVTQDLMPAWVVGQAPLIGKRTSDRDGQEAEFDQKLTVIYQTIRKDPFLDGEGVDFVHDHDVAYMAAQDAAMAQTKAKKKSKNEPAAEADDEEKGLRMMSYVEAIVPGVSLSVSLRIRPQMQEAQIGLLLLALLEWTNDQRLAGGSRRGFGTFQPTLRLYNENLDGGHADIFEAVSEGGSIARYKLTASMKTYVDAANAALSEVTVAGLEDLLTTHSRKKAA